MIRPLFTIYLLSARISDSKKKTNAGYNSEKILVAFLPSLLPCSYENFSSKNQIETFYKLSRTYVSSTIKPISFILVCINESRYLYDEDKYIFKGSSNELSFSCFKYKL